MKSLPVLGSEFLDVLLVSVNLACSENQIHHGRDLGGLKSLDRALGELGSLGSGATYSQAGHLGDTDVSVAAIC